MCIFHEARTQISKVFKICKKIKSTDDAQIQNPRKRVILDFSVF
jgi:hypothetical protein